MKPQLMLFNKIDLDWSENIRIANACKSIVSTCLDKHMGEKDYLYLNNIASISGIDNISLEELGVVTQYLSGSRASFFNSGFEYSDYEDCFTLDDDNCHYVMSENAIAHPETGHIIHNAKDNVYMFFVVAENFINE